MERTLNPYAPGAGLQPYELAGRETLLAKTTADMRRVLLGRSTNGLMLTGLRGVGKTVLLNKLLGIATDLGFQSIKVEAPEGGTLPKLLAQELRRLLYALDLKAAAGHRVRQAFAVFRNFATQFKISLGELEVGMERAPGLADSGDIEQDLPQLMIAVAQAAAEKNTAIGLFVDEVQYLSNKELAAVIVACHEIAQRGLPFFFVGAGLPHVAALAGNAKSYAERLFDYPEIGQLDVSAATAALVVPARQNGVEFDDDAIAAILEITQGYPYFIQTWGSFVWDAAQNSPIRLEVVRSSNEDILNHLDKNFFRVRFDRLTALEQKYLRAMAELGAGPHKTGEIADILGVTPSAVATVRQSLITKKAMVWSQRHGETGFTVPLFDAFMKRQIPELERHTPKQRRKSKSSH